jgi:outer membrane protein OmpA-like peptidoglycan-associated protein
VYDTKAAIELLREQCDDLEADVVRVFCFEVAFETVAIVPVIGTKVYIYDESGAVVDSAVIYSRGKFNVDRLERQQTYSIKRASQHFDPKKASLVSVLQAQKRRLPYLRDGYSYRPIDVAPVQDTEFNFDRFLLATDAPIEDDTKVYLHERDQEAMIDSSMVELDGSFKFKELDRSKEYDMKFSDKVDPQQAKLYAVNGDKTVELPSAQNGGFGVTAAQLPAPTQGAIALHDARPRMASSGEVITNGNQAYQPIPEHIAKLSDADRYRKYHVLQFDERYLPDPVSKVLVRNEHGTVVSNQPIYEGGWVIFDRLIGERSYTITVDDETFTMEGAALYDLFKGERKRLSLLENDAFLYRPTVDYGDSELRREMVISLSDEGDEDGERAEKQNDHEDAFALTPPVDEANETVKIEEEDKVNKTVFDKAKPVAVEEERKPVRATGVLDDSDYRLKSGLPQIVETNRGWNMHFDFNEFLLTDYQIDYIYKVVIPMLRENPDMILTLEGHTDDVGTEDVNYRVSILRISNVLYHLEMAGIEDTRIRVVPKGETEPVAPNDTEMGRAQNRRVEFIRDGESLNSGAK